MSPIGKIALAIYAAGYAVYVVAAAVAAWPRMRAFDFWAYMAFQIAFYGPFWPLFLRA